MTVPRALATCEAGRCPSCEGISEPRACDVIAASASCFDVTSLFQGGRAGWGTGRHSHMLMYVSERIRIQDNLITLVGTAVIPLQLSLHRAVLFRVRGET